MKNPDQKSAAASAAGICANCGNYLSPGDSLPNSTGAMCCSSACAIISDEELERSIMSLAAPQTVECTNCGRQLMTLDGVFYSQDGLAFCSQLCEQKYPKPIGARELRPVLAGAALAVLALTAFLLVRIVYWFKYSR
jgi:ribosomal protein L32